MAELTVRVDDARVRALLKRAIRKSADLRPVWGELNATVIQPAMVQRFDAGGAVHGPAWKPLAASTRRQRQRRGGNRGGVSRPLWDFGRLRGAWVKTGPESVVVFEPHKFERGVGVPYAAAHQTGSSRMPARELVTEELAQHVAEKAAPMIAKHIAD